MSDVLNAFDADELLALSILDIEKERLDAALEKLKIAATRTVCPAMVYAELGRLYSKLKLFDRAKPRYEQYLQIVPGAVTELFQWGMAHFESGEGPQALGRWAEVLRLAPSYPPALFFVPFQLARQGDVVRAHEGCRLALSVIAEDNLYFGRAKELLQKIEADPAYIQALKQDPGTARKTH